MNSFTLENSFYGYDYGPETRTYTQQNYREIGGGFERTLNDYRVCLAQIQVEMVQSRGWLKPIKLKEITGTPAAEVIAKELKEGRERKKREEYIRKYTSKMAAKENAKGFSFAQHHLSVPSLHAAGNTTPTRQSANTTTNRRLVRDDGVLA